MSGWIVVKRGSYYGPFSTQSKAVVWAEKKLGTYIGGDWCVCELWNPKNVD
jgi:predicted NAD/FAD-dependent oxidoreductase